MGTIIDFLNSAIIGTTDLSGVDSETKMMLAFMYTLIFGGVLFVGVIVIALFLSLVIPNIEEDK